MDSSSLRVAALEQELQDLRNSTTEALEEAWGEVETLTRENSHREDLLFSMQAQLGEKLSEESSQNGMMMNRRNILSLSRADSTRSALSMCSVASAHDETSLPPQPGRGWMTPVNNNSRHGAATPPTPSMTDVRSVMTSDSSDSNETNKSGIGLLLSAGLRQRKEHKRVRKHTEIEKNLMRQLEILQEDRNRMIHDLEFKLYQREAAIETLERTVAVKEETIESLRYELAKVRLEEQRHLPASEKPRMSLHHP